MFLVGDQSELIYTIFEQQNLSREITTLKNLADILHASLVWRYDCDLQNCRSLMLFNVTPNPEAQALSAWFRR
jgi:hypothetical protein